MWPKSQIVLLLLAGMMVPAYAQRYERGTNAGIAAVPSASSPARLMTMNEGLAVLGAAMETAHHRPINRDCSHFVHEIYERAGFPYSYENSVAIYDGIGDFQRVSHPQPGDLIVWRGHIGIIVNPVQRSFFSSLRTGFGVEKYDSRYWRKRGHPRFYRYVKSEASPLTLASAKTATLNEDRNEDGEEIDPDVAKVATQAVPQEASVPAQPEPVWKEPDRPIVVAADRASPDSLRQALEEKFADTTTSLEHIDLLNATKPVVIVETFQIKKVHVKHDQGWAEVQMNEPSSLAGGEANLQRRSEKQRWPLYRNGQQWQMELPTNAIYLPKDTAVRLLAHELAAMTGQRSPSSHGSPQEAQLARLLDRLLGE